MKNEIVKLKRDCFLYAIAAIGFFVAFLVFREKLNPFAFSLTLLFTFKWSLNTVISLVKYIRLKNSSKEDLIDE